MKKILLLVLLLLLASFCVCLSPEETLEKYYSASAAEDMDEFFSVLDTSGISADDLQMEHEFIQNVWDLVDDQEFSIGAIRKAEADDGTTILLNYILDFSYTGPEGTTSMEGAEYVALLLKDSGEWTVAYAIPLEDYLDLRNNMTSMEALKEEAAIMGDEMENIEQNQKKVTVEVRPGTDKKMDPMVVLLAAGSALVILLIVIVFLVIIFRKKPDGKKKEAGKEPVKPAQKASVGTGKTSAAGKSAAKEAAAKTTAKPVAKSMSKKEYSAAMKILRQRYAKGEITTDDYNRMKQELSS